MELYFEIVRKKQHLLVQARDNWTPKDLKKAVEGILKISSEKQSLRKPANEQRTEWTPMEEKQTLQELGYTPKNARADDPALLALVVLPEDKDKQPDIEALSTPPAVPEVMAQGRQQAAEMDVPEE